MCENFKVAVPKLPVIGITIPHNRTIQAAHQHLLEEKGRYYRLYTGQFQLS